ncbi:MAG: LysR substrate-binding domain-containing protein [Hyphomicrobiales bacterium]|nr:LysR substrate-binding domain-containing protein [Hyphomicrobiales bacterium]
MTQFSLRQLRYLQALAHAGHFGRAAQACHVTQPALSMQVRQLEDMLGVELFERAPVRVTLTHAGKEVLRRADEILTKSQDLMDFARHAQGVLVGELKLGIIPTIGPYLLPDALEKIGQLYPELSLRLRETQTSVLIEELVQGQLDVVLAALPVTGGELAEAALFEDRFLLAVPAGHPLAGRAATDLKCVEGERLLLLEEGHCFRDQALSYCAQADPATTAGFGAASFATILQMVASGYGVTLLPEMAAASEVGGRQGISVLRFAAPQPRRVIGLVWRKSSPRRADFSALGALVVDIAREHGWEPSVVSPRGGGA